MIYSLSRGLFALSLVLGAATGISFAEPECAETASFANMQNIQLSEPLAPETIQGWAADDHAAALSAFIAHCQQSRGHTYPTKAFGISDAKIRRICASISQSSSNDAKALFEQYFSFHKVQQTGFVTGYYMPELDGSLVRTPEYSIPLHGYPQDLPVMPTRGEVMDGALDGLGLEVLWVKDPVDAFFTAVQGSAQVHLTNGEVRRLTFAGKSGHPYTAIGQVLIEHGEISKDAMSMTTLRQWFTEHPEQRDEVLRHNKSYIFFTLQSAKDKETVAVGGAGTALTNLRSLAVDSDLHTYGSLIFVSSDLKGYDQTGQRFAKLMVAQDTGSAIKGPARGDIFVGSGAKAGEIAGNIRHDAEFYLLVPKL